MPRDPNDPALAACTRLRNQANALWQVLSADKRDRVVVLVAMSNILEQLDVIDNETQPPLAVENDGVEDAP